MLSANLSTIARVFPKSQLERESVTNLRTLQQNGADHLGLEGRKLESAGFEPKERGGKIIWQRPDTGFWVSQEMALHLLKKGKEAD